jgi:hypothetical protein
MPSYTSVAAIVLLAVSVDGARKAGGIVDQGKQLSLQLPDGYDFSDHGAPLVKVQVEAGVPMPEQAKDMLVTLSVDDRKDLHLHLSEKKDAPKSWIPVAWANYKNTVKQNGWGYLSVSATTDKRVSDDLKMYASGFIEGYSTAQQIRDFQYNAGALMGKDEKDHQAIGNIRNLFATEIGTMRKEAHIDHNNTVLNNANQPKDPWWAHAKFMMIQGWGILDAYNQHVDKVKGKPMSMIDLFILNSDGETPELEMAYDFQEVLLRQSTKECEGKGEDCDDGDNTTSKDDAFLQKAAKRRTVKGHLRSARDMIRKARARRHHTLQMMDDRAWRKFKQTYGRCSALVRLAPNNADIFMGHTTFSDYSEMNRIWKYYDFPLEGAPARVMGFSSYPGVAGSTDDYYVMDTGVAVTETTVSMLSDEAFDKLDDNGTYIPDYMRIMLANRLAKDAKDWVDWMKKSATGTYNSQWMVIDYNKFKKGQKLQDGTFWVLEQAPGVSVGKDMSQLLQKQGFWASENRGYFSAIRNVSGESEAEEIHGNLFSEHENPRAHIFQATAPKVNTLDDMRHEMERNEWPHEVDGGPANTPDHAIASRGDLDKERPTPNGGVDSKVTNACLVKLLSAQAIAGPTHDGQKPFKWTDDKGRNKYPDYPKAGLPDLWNFDWVHFTPKGELTSLELPKECK